MRISLLLSALASTVVSASAAADSISDMNDEIDETTQRTDVYRRGPVTPQQAFAGGGDTTINNRFEGDTDPDDFDTQMNNTMWRMTR